MSCPFFSCVVPVKGARPFFQEAMASLAKQDFGEGLEIIVQYGGEVSGGVGELVSGGVKYYREDDNGQSDALNKGFAKAKGEWLFWLNADDVLLPGALKKVLDRIDTTDRIEWIAGNTIYIDKEDKVIGTRWDAKWRPWFGKRMSVWTGGPSAFFSRSLWNRLGGFDTNLRYVMDIDLWTRWAKADVEFVELNEYVWGFREHDSSLTASGVNRSAQLSELSCIDDRCGVSSVGFWRNVTRAVSVFDGSWIKRKHDTARFRGKHWSEIFR